MKLRTFMQKMADHKTQQAVVERVCDENLEQGALYYQRGKYFAGLRVFVENFAAQILQPPQRDQDGVKSSNLSQTRQSNEEV